MFLCLADVFKDFQAQYTFCLAECKRDEILKSSSLWDKLVLWQRILISAQKYLKIPFPWTAGLLCNPQSCLIQLNRNEKKYRN